MLSRLVYSINNLRHNKVTKFNVFVCNFALHCKQNVLHLNLGLMMTMIRLLLSSSTQILTIIQFTNGIYRQYLLIIHLNRFACNVWLQCIASKSFSLKYIAHLYFTLTTIKFSPIEALFFMPALDLMRAMLSYCMHTCVWIYSNTLAETMRNNPSIIAFSLSLSLRNMFNNWTKTKMQKKR